MQAIMAKVQHNGAQVIVICTEQSEVVTRSVQLQLRVSNFTISMAEAMCLQKALGIVLGGG